MILRPQIKLTHVEANSARADRDFGEVGSNVPVEGRSAEVEVACRAVSAQKPRSPLGVIATGHLCRVSTVGLWIVDRCTDSVAD